MDKQLLPCPLYDEIINQLCGHQPLSELSRRQIEDICRRYARPPQNNVAELHKQFVDKMKPIDPSIVKIVDENFWDLLATPQADKEMSEEKVKKYLVGACLPEMIDECAKAICQAHKEERLK